MIDDKYIVDNLFTKQGNINSNYIKASYIEKHPDLKDYLDNRYSDSKSYGETVYRIQLGIETRPVCPCCGGEVMFNPQHQFARNRNGNPFLVYCSPKCMANSDEVKKKKSDACIEKYGVDNPFKSTDIQDKQKNTVVEKYGVENVFQSESIKEKIKESNTEKYGVDHPMKSNTIRERVHNTKAAKRGKNHDARDAFKYEKVFADRIKEGIHLDISDAEALREYKRICNTKGTLHTNPNRNRTVLKFQYQNFYAWEIDAFSNNPDIIQDTR